MNMTNTRVILLVIVHSVIHAALAGLGERIYVNSNQVQLRTPIDVKEYDAIALYRFEDEETVAIDCKHSEKSVYSKIKYFDNTGRILFETIAFMSNVEDVHIKLTQESHFNYVECYYKYFFTPALSKYKISVTRIIFKFLSAEDANSVITLHINGMYIQPTGTVYKYVYYAGETADISCESRHDDHLLNLDYGGKKKMLSNANITLYLNKNNDKTIVSCTAIDIHTRGLIETVHVQLIQSLRDFYITGLKKANILQHYPKTKYTSVIYYQYSDNEKLTINCSKSRTEHDFYLGPGPKATKLEWTFNESSVVSTEVTKPDITSINLALVLQASFDNLTIKCILPTEYISTRQTVIKLVYKKTSDIVCDESVSTHWMWISSGIVMIVITTIIILLIKNHKTRQSSVTTNINLSSRRLEKVPEERPIVEREQQPLPPASHEAYHYHCDELIDTTNYSEAYYEPSFPRRTPTDSDNEYTYVDCAHLGERHASAFDAVATRIALEKAKRTNRNDYSNLKEICRPGYCVLRAQDRK